MSVMREIDPVPEPSAPRLRPHDLGPEHRVLSHFTLSRFHPIEDRIRLAAENGFAGIGLWAGHYERLEQEGRAPGELKDLLATHGLVLAEIEVVPGLGADGPGGERAGEIEAVAWRMADEFESRYLQVIGPGGPDRAAAAAAFGALCDRAGDHGLVVGLEFLPFTDIVTLHDARAIVETAGRPNGGVCVDVWHLQRGLRDLDALASWDGRLITGLQLNDGAAVPVDDDYYTDCLENRVAPGEGDFDLAAIISAIRATGTRVPWSLEVPSAKGWVAAESHVAAVARGATTVLGS